MTHGESSERNASDRNRETLAGVLNLFVLFAVADFFLGEARGEIRTWLDHYRDYANFGFLFGQCTLLSFWLALGTGAIFRRITLFLLATGLLLSLTVYSSDLGARVTAKYEVVLSVELAAFALLVRWGTRWRWGRPVEDSNAFSPYGFSLRELCLAMLACGVVLGVGRAVVLEFYEALKLNVASVGDWDHGLKYGTIFFIHALPAFALLPLVHGGAGRRWIWGVVWLIAFPAALVLDGVYESLLPHDDGDFTKDAVAAVILNLVVFQSLVFLHVSGFRLLRPVRHRPIA